jgi:hypothetical protein
MLVTLVRVIYSAPLFQAFITSQQAPAGGDLRE